MSAAETLLLHGFAAWTAWKKPVDLCSTTDHPQSYLVGEQYIDGVLATHGTRVLLRGQIPARENGVYVVNSLGPWTRAKDFDSETSMLPGSTIVVCQGTSNSGVYRMTTPVSGTVTPGSTNIVFSKVGEFSTSILTALGIEFPGAATISAGGGANTLTLDANTIEVSGPLEVQGYSHDPKAVLSWHQPVRAATTADIWPMAGLLTVDGVSVVVNDRVLVKNNSIASQNGIYIVQNAGWTRATDWNDDLDIVRGCRIAVTEGTANAGKTFYLSSAGPYVVGVTNLTFTEVPGGGGAVDFASVSAALAAATGPVAINGQSLTEVSNVNGTNEGNVRLQAFDVGGSPSAYFDAAGDTGDATVSAPGAVTVYGGDINVNLASGGTMPISVNAIERHRFDDVGLLLANRDTGTAALFIGGYNGSANSNSKAIYLGSNAITPSGSNYALYGDSSSLNLNAPGSSLSLKVVGVDKFVAVGSSNTETNQYLIKRITNYHAITNSTGTFQYALVEPAITTRAWSATGYAAKKEERHAAMTSTNTGGHVLGSWAPSQDGTVFVHAVVVATRAVDGARFATNVYGCFEVTGGTVTAVGSSTYEDEKDEFTVAGASLSALTTNIRVVVSPATTDSTKWEVYYHAYYGQV